MLQEGNLTLFTIPSSQLCVKQVTHKLCRIAYAYKRWFNMHKSRCDLTLSEDQVPIWRLKSK